MTLPKLNRMFWVFALLAGAGALAVWHFRGGYALAEATLEAAELFLWVSVLIALGFVIGEVMRRLVPPDYVSRTIGAESGWRGLTVATLAGAVTPGGPFTSFPLVLALSRSGADIGTVVAFVTSWSVLGINRVILWEIPLVGADFAALRILVSLPMPFLVGIAVRKFRRFM